MSLQAQFRILTTLYRTECQLSVPKAPSYHITTFAQNHDRLIVLLNTPIDLINSAADNLRIVAHFFVTTETKWRRLIWKMRFRQPNEVLNEAAFCGSDNFLIPGKSCGKNSFFVYGHCDALPRILGLRIRHWLENLQSGNYVDNKV